MYDLDIEKMGLIENIYVRILLKRGLLNYFDSIFGEINLMR